MQKFGLDSLQTGRLSALEMEIFKEKASALGMAGASLQKSIDQYYREAEKGWPSGNQERLAERIRENLTAFVIQRELVGLVHDNVAWVLSNYSIPPEILKQFSSTARNE